MPDEPHYHYHNGYKEHEQGNTVHAVHKLYVYIFWRIGVSLADVEVGEHLIPDIFFHNPKGFTESYENLRKKLYLQPHGGLAHLARALAWHARGNRFDSGILHKL